MKKIVKISLVIVLLISITLLSFKYIENIEADSGWDSGYDSSWDSGSDWGGSSWDNDYDSSWDNDYDSSSSGSIGSSCTTTECKVGALVSILISFAITGAFPALIIILSITSTKKQKQRREQELKLMFKAINQEDANLVIPNFNMQEFNFKAYQMFYDVQMAWMNFDYDKLKELLTDEIYNNYLMQLEALKLKNHKNIMKEFQLIEICLNNLKEENDKYIAEVYLNVKFFDYVENIKSGMVLRGTPNRRLNNIYKLTFIRTKGETNNINKCPQCGATVEGNSTGICEYCKSKLINDNYSWVMSKKEIVRQK